MLTYDEAHGILSKISDVMILARKDIDALLRAYETAQRRFADLHRIFTAVERLTGPKGDGGGIDLAAVERCGPDSAQRPKMTPWSGH